jgi:4-carboxymuconolactone decarboxylase
MKKLLAVFSLTALLAAPQPGCADDITRFTRFAPLKAEELSPAQKAWADTIAAPPRNGKFVNPPYRAYIRSPDLAPKLTALAEHLRWNTSLPPRLSEMAILITARQWTAQYEWFAHYPLAIKAGLDPKVAGDIAAGRRPDTMKDDEAACTIWRWRSIATRRSPIPSTGLRWRNSASAASSISSPSWAFTILRR